MHLFKFIKDKCLDSGQDFYVQILFTKRWAFFQGTVTNDLPVSWPYFQISFGTGSLMSLSFDIYKFGLFINLIARTWKI